MKGEAVEKLLTVQDLANVLSLNYRAALRLTRIGIIPSIRIGRRIYIPENFLEQKKLTASEPKKIKT